MGVHNRAIDMINLLFEQMENLNDAGPEELDDEIKRANAIAKVAQQVNNTYAQAIKAKQVTDEDGGRVALLDGGGNAVE